MAKIFGLFGSMTGKLADTVMSVRNGEQIARKYQPIVYNPSSPAQVAQRAKLKLLSQLSAVMAPVIAIRGIGSVSSRNLFTKVNFPAVTYATDTASVNLPGIQLTSSAVGLGAVSASRNTENIVAYFSSNEAPTDVDRVVYAMFAKGSDNKLRFVGSRSAVSTGPGSDWQVTFPLVNAEVVILAYGVRDNTDAARAVFGNMQVISAEEVAKIIVNRVLTETDVTLTETRGVQLSASSRNVDPDESEKKSSKK